MKLRQKYGAARPFDDDSLFADIISLTHPAVKTFIEKYIQGEDEPDYMSTLKLIGYDYEPEHMQEVYYFGNFGLRYDEDKEQFSFTQVGTNSLGIRNDDILVSINREEVSEDNAERMFREYFLENEDGKDVLMIVKRKGEVMDLRGSPGRGRLTTRHHIFAQKHPGKKEEKNRKIFLGED
jgi:predicted metalloprotease with PDZ domain